MILGTQTLDSLLILATDVNPSTAGGIASPIGSFGSATDGSGFFIKTGALDTDWTQVVTSGSLGLSSVLAVSNSSGAHDIIIDSGQAIRSSLIVGPAQGYIDLAFGGVAGYSAMTSNGAVGGDALVEVSTDYSGLTNLGQGLVGAPGYNIGVEMFFDGSQNAVNLWTSGSKSRMTLGVSLTYDPTNLQYEDILVVENGTVAASVSTGVRNAIFIGTNSSTINAGILNTVLIGASGITATLPNAVYFGNGSSMSIITSSVGTSADPTLYMFNGVGTLPTATNYILKVGSANSGNTILQGNAVLVRQSGSLGGISVTNGLISFNSSGAAIGNATTYRFFGVGKTTQTASTEQINFAIEASTTQFATGPISTVRSTLISANTYSAVAASTITNSATLAISGAPISGTNIIQTNPYAVWIQSGGLKVEETGGAFSSFRSFTDNPTEPKLYMFLSSATAPTASNYTMKKQIATSNLLINAESAASGIALLVGNVTKVTLTTSNLKQSYGGGTDLIFQDLVGSPTSFAMYMNATGVAPTGLNYHIVVSAVNTMMLNSAFFKLQQGNVDKMTMDANNFTFTPAAGAAATTTAWKLAIASNSGATASTEQIGFHIATTSMGHAAGALALNRFAVIEAPTYTFIAASTLTDMATLALTGGPISGSNNTPTNTHALLIQAGAVNGAGTAPTNSFGLTVNAQTGATNNFAAKFLGGSVVLSGAALATNATTGFTYLPSCAGVPTGVPVAVTGTIPCVVDSTNNRMYIFSGGAWVALN